MLFVECAYPIHVCCATTVLFVECAIPYMSVSVHNNCVVHPINDCCFLNELTYTMLFVKCSYPAHVSCTTTVLFVKGTYPQMSVATQHSCWICLSQTSAVQQLCYLLNVLIPQISAVQQLCYLLNEIIPQISVAQQLCCLLNVLIQYTSAVQQLCYL